MGLLDVLNGMQNGPGGDKTNKTTQSKSGGMSPITMALIGLLANKAMKGLSGGPAMQPPPPTPSATNAACQRAPKFPRMWAFKIP